MSERGLTTNQTAAALSSVIYPGLLLDLTFEDNTYHVWCGIGTLTVGGVPYVGVGTMGRITTISEGIGVEAKGITLTLSGLDPTWLPESMNEINLASRAKLYWAFLNPLATSMATLVIDSPLCIFSGIMDGPSIDMDTSTAAISIDVESKLIEMNRSRGGRYTDQDQKARYPLDESLQWVSYNIDKNILWNS
jgi:hypothetical protein